ncbi:hypothetical protein [Streptomyces sp. NPDC048659]|uniref:hypothetical protein n=1 Tax=Streptomyces sp. NPDC048659 TaxID=3155489 RepID=UPI00341D61B2
MIRHLPHDAAVQREVHGESAEWSVSDHLLAAAVDHLAVANWMFHAVNTGEDDEAPDPPQPIPRPGVRNEDEGEDDGHPDGNPSGRSADGAEGADSAVLSPFQLARFFG